MQRDALLRISGQHGWALFFLVLLVAFAAPGCGTTNSRSATEQILASDAVDTAVSQIDISPLAGQKVYLDTRYLQDVKTIGFVNAPYITSSLRQQIIAAGCYLQDSADQADYIIEARVGALGTDGHDVIYGIPKSNSLNAAAGVLSGVPALPTIPEISVGQKNQLMGAVKISLFAYDRATHSRVWQSGIARAISTAEDRWILGAGPFQEGTIYNGVRFAGRKLRTPFSGPAPLEFAENRLSTYRSEYLYRDPNAPQASPPAADSLSQSPTPGQPAPSTTPPGPIQQAAASVPAPASPPPTAPNPAPAQTPTPPAPEPSASPSTQPEPPPSAQPSAESAADSPPGKARL